MYKTNICRYVIFSEISRVYEWYEGLEAKYVYSQYAFYYKEQHFNDDVWLIKS